MTLDHSPNSGNSIRDWIQEHPFAALCAAALVGLLGGTLFNQVIAQRQVGDELVRLTDACNDSRRSMQRLTDMKPTIDGTRSLLAELKQTERELDAGVQSLGGIRNLGFDLAEVRRQIGNTHQTVRQLDQLVDDLEVQSTHALTIAQEPLQRLQTIDILLQQHADLVPQLEANLASLLQLSRTLQQEGGNAIEAESSLQTLISHQNRLIGLLSQLDTELGEIDGLDESIHVRLATTRDVIASAESVASEAARIHQSLLDAQADQHRAQRNLQEILGVTQILAEQSPSATNPINASPASSQRSTTRLVVEPYSRPSSSRTDGTPLAAPRIPVQNASARIPTAESLEAARREQLVPRPLNCDDADPVIVSVPLDATPITPPRTAERTSLSSRRISR